MSWLPSSPSKHTRPYSPLSSVPLSRRGLLKGIAAMGGVWSAKQLGGPFAHLAHAQSCLLYTSPSPRD